MAANLTLIKEPPSLLNYPDPNPSFTWLPHTVSESAPCVYVVAVGLGYEGHAIYGVDNWQICPPQQLFPGYQDVFPACWRFISFFIYLFIFLLILLFHIDKMQKILTCINILRASTKGGKMSCQGAEGGGGASLLSVIETAGTTRAQKRKNNNNKLRHPKELFKAYIICLIETYFSGWNIKRKIHSSLCLFNVSCIPLCRSSLTLTFHTAARAAFDQDK